jgi:hypothetical protein
MKKPKPEFIEIDLDKILGRKPMKKKAPRKRKERKTVPSCNNQRDLF